MTVLAALLVALPTSDAGAPPRPAAAAPHVLVLQSYGHGFEPYETLESALRDALPDAFGAPVELYEVSLESTRLLGSAGEAALLDYLSALDTQRGLGLVVAVGGPATRFVQSHRDRIFVDTPFLIAGAEERVVKSESLAPTDARVSVRIDFGREFDNVFSLFPGTKQIVFVIGASPYESLWADMIPREFERFRDRASLTMWNGLTLDQMVQRAATLPTGAVLFYGMLAIDAGGMPHTDDAGLVALREASSVPVFGLFETQLGKGIVGGPLLSIKEIGEESARAAARVLHGAAPSSVRPPSISATRSTYDGRELRRFGIEPTRLPADAVILFRKPTLWQTNKWGVLGIVAVCVAEAALIVFLLASLAGRHRAEDALRDVSRRLIVAQEDERARLARELHDDITQRLARLAIDVGTIERRGPPEFISKPLLDVQHGIVRLSEDVHSLSYRLHSSLVEDLGLPDALDAECHKFGGASDVAVRFRVADLPGSVPRPAALCLFRVAQECLRNVHRHAHARNVEVALSGVDGGLQLAVRDDGVGFDPVVARARRSLGHVSLRERIHLAGGELDIDSAPGRGTTVVAWVPLIEEGV